MSMIQDDDKVSRILDTIGQLTVPEASELKDKMADKFKVSMDVGKSPIGEASVEAEEEIPEVFNTLKIIEYGPQKLQMIKTVREVLGLSLKDSKDSVDSGIISLVDIPEDKKQTLIELLTECGSKVKLES